MNRMGNNQYPSTSASSSYTKSFLEAFTMQLKSLVTQKPLSLKDHLQNLVLGHYNELQQKKIMELLQQWKQYPLKDLIEKDPDQQQIQYYHQVPILSARVFLQVKQLFDSASYKKQNKYQFQGVQKFSKLIQDQEIVLSYNRFGFQKNVFKSRISYSIHQGTAPVQKSRQYIERIQDWAKKQNIEFIPTLLSFLKKIGLLIEDQQKILANVFLLQLERITKEEQRQMFLKDISNLQFQQILQGQISEQELARRYQNYYYYKNKKLKYGEPALQRLHNKITDYNFLEGVHDYVQWMFPNHYRSAFNSSSAPLGYTQAYLFLKDKSIGIELLRSIYIFFDFMGIRVNLQTLELEICSERRLKDVVLVNFHNHLRIMRVLACLSITGLRKLALNLIDFLDRYTSPGNLLSAQRAQFQKSWQIYGEKHIQKAKQMCFLETESFPEDHQILKIAASMQMSSVNQIVQKISKKQNKKIQGNIQDLEDFHRDENNNKQIQQQVNLYVKKQQAVDEQPKNITNTVDYTAQLVDKQNVIDEQPQYIINKPGNVAQLVYKQQSHAQILQQPTSQTSEHPQNIQKDQQSNQLQGLQMKPQLLEIAVQNQQNEQKKDKSNQISEPQLQVSETVPSKSDCCCQLN